MWCARVIFHRANKLSRSLRYSRGLECEYTVAGNESLSSRENVSAQQISADSPMCLSTSVYVLPESGWKACMFLNCKKINMTWAGRVFTFPGHCAKQWLIIIVRIWQCVCECLLWLDRKFKQKRRKGLVWIVNGLHSYTVAVSSPDTRPRRHGNSEICGMVHRGSTQVSQCLVCQRCWRFLQFKTHPKRPGVSTTLTRYVWHH